MYSVAKLLHQAIFLNGTLVNMETWPNSTPGRMAMFERAEQSLFRKVLAAHSKSPIECFYLELGVVPFRFQVMKRRILYYQTIMKRDNEEITKRVVLSQMQSRIKGDFYMQVSKDMEDLNISDNDITSSRSSLEEKVNKQATNIAFAYLQQLARKHSKVNENLYKDLKGMEYFNDARFSPDLVNLLFKFRTRMYDVRNNFRNKYQQIDILCPLCKLENDTQEHMFKCSIIQKAPPDNGTQQCIYEDIFSSNTDTLLTVAKKLKELVEAREEITIDKQT